MEGTLDLARLPSFDYIQYICSAQASGLLDNITYYISQSSFEALYSNDGVSLLCKEMREVTQRIVPTRVGRTVVAF